MFLVKNITKIIWGDNMVKEKVLDYANKISNVKRGSKMGIKPEYPEYKILEPLLTDEMAEVAYA